MNPVKTSTHDIHEVIHLGEEEVFTATEVATAINGIKSGKAAGEDEIRLEMLKALIGEGILWLTRVCQVAWKFGKTTRHWQTGVIIPIFKKGDRKQCTNYRGISLLSLPGKVYAKCLEKKCREIVESKLEDGQCGYRPCRSTTDQIAGDLVLLSSTESGLQRALNSFADACNTAGKKISKAKTGVLHLSKNLGSVRVTSEWRKTEARREVQVSWGCIYE